MEIVSEYNPFFSNKQINPARVAAVKILNRIERSGSYIDKLVDFEFNTGNYSPEDKGLLQELVYGVTRWKAKLDWVLIGFFHGDFQKCFNYVKNALRLALYQILFLDKIPHPAAIDESVELVKKKQGKKTAGLVNGVLRNIVRNLDNIRYPKEEEDKAFYYSVMESHPKWMVERWFSRFGQEDAIKLLKSNNTHRVISFNLNNSKISNQEFIQLLTDNNLEFEQSKYLESSFRILNKDIKIPQTEQFTLGRLNIQDTSASLVCKLANPKPGNKILDTCAAPGGKTMFLAELTGENGSVTAVDMFEARTKQIDQNTKRLGFNNVTTIASDFFEFKSDEKFDIVLVDAPCSGHGTISHKPDIKWTSERENVVKLSKLQYELLEKASKFVHFDGVLVYSTCTIEAEENENVIKKFLENNPLWVLDKAQNHINEELCTPEGYMLTLPHKHNMDGAFAARLIKKV